MTGRLARSPWWPFGCGSLSVLLALVLATLLGASPPALADRAPRATPAGAEAEPDARFAGIAGAWMRRDAEAIVSFADPDVRGTIVLALLADPPVSGTYPKAQARQTLKAYFERIRGNPVLRDVTTAESKRAVPGTRLYDYTHRPEGRDPVTTRLEVALKQVSGAWILASISERPRPRTSAALPGPR